MNSENLFELFFKNIFEKIARPILANLADEILKSKNQELKGEEPIGILQAAEIVRKKPTTIYKYCSEGRIPFHKNGAKNDFYRSELLEWLKNNNKS